MKKTLFTLFIVLVTMQNAFAWGWAIRDAVRQPSENPSYYLGDQVYFSWDIDATGWGAVLKKAGVGTTNTSAGMNWQNIIWVDEAGDGGGNNEGVKSATFTVNSVATWYYSLWLGFNNTFVGDNGRWYNGNSGWNEGLGTFLSSSFTVSDLNTPGSQTAAKSSSNPQSIIDLNWARDAQSHNVMIVRKSGGSFTAPTQGTAYTVGNSIGTGVVVYNGSGILYSNTGLAPSTGYEYAFYSENNSYYSAAVTTTTVTTDAFFTPTSQTATVNGTNPESKIDLAWAKDAQNHNVMIVRKKLNQSWTEPTPGTAYAVDASIGSGVVVYNGSGINFANK